MAEGGPESQFRLETGPNRHAMYFDDSDSDTSIASTDSNETTDVPESPAPGQSISFTLPIAHLPQRELKKEGFLYKQGGPNHDKGWKKRYIRFDGQTLRYYPNEKIYETLTLRVSVVDDTDLTTASLRIIPVGIMEDVAHEETKRNSTSSLIGGAAKSYKFILKTFNRTYLFATDNNDNCIQWVCSLSEAILNKDKENSQAGVSIGGSTGKPDIQGPMKIGRKSKKFHAALKGEIFRYYYNKEDFEIDCPVHELDIRVTRAKKLDELKLQLYGAPNQKLVFHFERAEERDQWKMFFDEAWIKIIGGNEIVKEIKQNQDNRTCADCTSETTNWASINLGIVLCIQCAGIHRGLGVNYSKIRSLQLDTIFGENAALLQLFAVIGNKNANKFWLARPSPDIEINESTPDCIRRRVIHRKYVAKEFISKSDLKPSDINKNFIDAVRKGETFQVMKFVELGADINSKSEEDDLDAIEIARKEEYLVLLEYLEQNKDRTIETSNPNPDVDQTMREEMLRRSSIHFDGYLEKTGPNMKGFLKRWFVLHYCRLTYFDDKKGIDKQKEKGSIDMDQIVCAAIMYCNERPFCFDLTCKEKKRIYRFAAQDMELRRKWIDVIYKVICPESVLKDVPVQIKQYKIAGFFFVQQHSQGPWIKSWFGVGINTIDIHYLNGTSQYESIPINPGSLKVYKLNNNRSSKMLTRNSSLLQLDVNKTVELQIEARVLRIQGHHPDDTEKVFTILNPILNT